MKYIFASITLFLSLFLAVGSVLNLTFAQGKSQDTPGQMKKTENQQGNLQGNASGKKVEVGNVEAVIGNTIIIEDKNNNKKSEAVVDQNTRIVGDNKKKLRVSSIKLNDKVALMASSGADTSTDSAKPKRAIKVFVKDASSSAKLKRKAVQGVILEINGSILTIAHQIQRDRITRVLVSDTTFIKTKDKEGSASASLNSLQIGYRIVAMGDINEEGVLVARRIHVIPGKATGIFRRFPVSTPSASISPSITATPSATPSATPTSSPSATPTPT